MHRFTTFPLIAALFALLAGCDTHHLAKIPERLLTESEHVPTEIHFFNARESVVVRDPEMIAYILESMRTLTDWPFPETSNVSGSLSMHFVYEDLTIRTGGSVSKPAYAIHFRVGYDGGFSETRRFIEPVPERIDEMLDFLIDRETEGEVVFE
ncbi:MAG: hypothetical protein JJU00_15655 [Opitutales bacterium]|nr:hypothetical protein [Opitutales bacterium]